MGRQLKKVPLDFDWPINEGWKGYLMPDDLTRPCPNGECMRGETKGAIVLSDLTYLMSAAATNSIDSRKDHIHGYLYGIPNNPGLRPSPDLAEFFNALVDNPDKKVESHSIGGIQAYDIYRALLKAAKLPEDWGQCPTCKGEDCHPEDIEKRDAWKKTDPPIGPGFQLWENTSEGSPQSPVFKTLKELATWCSDNATTFGSETATAENWEKMLGADHVHHTEGNVTFI